VKFRFILLFIFPFCFSKIKADAAPKFHESVNIQLFSEQRPFSKVDSISALVFAVSNYPAIARLNSTTAEFWTGPSLHKTENGYQIFTHEDLSAFKVIIFLRGMKYESEVLSRFPGNQLYYLEVKDGKLKDVSPPFHQDMGTYFMFLLLTLFVEVLLGLIFFTKYKPLRSLKDYLFSFIAINIITHVALWYTYSHAPFPLFFLEIFVFMIESFYWQLYFRADFFKSLLYSFVTNITSWIIGGIVSFFI
jgi:hypothetical protein